MSPEIYLRLEQIIGSDRARPKRITPPTAVETDPPKKQRVTERPHFEAIVNVSRSAWWAGVRTGRYPKPIRLGPRTTVWLGSEVYAIGQKLTAE